MCVWVESRLRARDGEQLLLADVGLVFFFLDLSSLSSQAEEEREIELVPPFVCSSP
jgi:hypothetical protein